MNALLLEETEVGKLISLEETIEVVELAFEEKGKGRTQMPPKPYIYFKKFDGDFRTMPAYIKRLGAAGVKIVNVHPNNPKKNLPSVMGTILLLKPETGEPLSIMGGTEITRLRTGAAGGIAAKYLARADSSKVGLIGSGVQAKYQLLSLNELFDLKLVKVYDLYREKREQFVQETAPLLNSKIEQVDSGKTAAEEADILVTTTPSKSPVLKDEWIEEGVHINAIGADAKGKQELDPDTLKRSKIVVDEWKQASHSGEINVAVENGKISQKDIHADIGEIVSGKKIGREKEEELTVFDSTGLAIQDVATAWKVYENIEDKGNHRSISLY
ncbi:MAG: alanine dehydrogenase [Candidatus Hadarchaeota archaeon]